MNVFLLGISTDPHSGARKQLFAHEDVLQIGMQVFRRGLEEGPIRVVGVDRSKNLVALHHEGYTAYINRASGSQYSPAVVSLHRYELRNDYQIGVIKNVPGVHLLKCVAEVPIAR
jgi:hypothetical protein